MTSSHIARTVGLSLCTLLSSVASAENFSSEDATQLIRTTVDRAVEVLKNPELQGRENRPERHKRLREISNEVFDWSEMARRSLGVHWRDLNEAQRKRFTGTFKEILADHYLGQLDRFQGDEKVTHTGTEEAKNGYIVKMKLRTPSRAEVPIHFYVGDDKEVYDVAIEGVILTNHYRGTFNRQLVNSSFDVMMKKLEQKLAVQQRMAEKAKDGAEDS